MTKVALPLMASRFYCGYDVAPTLNMVYIIVGNLEKILNLKC